MFWWTVCPFNWAHTNRPSCPPLKINRSPVLFLQYTLNARICPSCNGDWNKIVIIITFNCGLTYCYMFHIEKFEMNAFECAFVNVVKLELFGVFFCSQIPTTIASSTKHFTLDQIIFEIYQLKWVLKFIIYWYKLKSTKCSLTATKLAIYVLSLKEINL